MQIDLAYKTSKGYFWSKEIAEKKKNRETYGYDARDKDEWEKVKEVYVLKAMDGQIVFELNKIAVK
jgi:hypothetical protein